MSALFGLAAYVRARLKVGRDLMALWFLGAIWCALVVVLLMVGQPILAAMTAIAALADNMGIGDQQGDGGAGKASRSGRWGWLFATLLASLVIAYGS